MAHEQCSAHSLQSQMSTDRCDVPLLSSRACPNRFACDVPSQAAEFPSRRGRTLRSSSVFSPGMTALPISFSLLPSFSCLRTLFGDGPCCIQTGQVNTVHVQSLLRHVHCACLLCHDVFVLHIVCVGIWPCGLHVPNKTGDSYSDAARRTSQAPECPNRTVHKSYSL